MPASSPSRSGPARPTALLHPRIAPWLVASAVLLFTVSAGLLMSRMLQQWSQARFDNAVLAAHDRVTDRLEAYVAALRGAAGLFAASQRVDWEEFRVYLDALDIERYYPGIQGIGFARRVPPDSIPEVTAEHRKALARSFQVWPDTPRADYFPIVLLHPLDERNLAALGFDMFTEPVRQRAMARARDTGQPALSGTVTLKQEIDVEDVQGGFLIYLPIYRHGTTPRTIDERRELIAGFVYSPFRADDLFAGIFGAERPRVAFQVFDGPIDGRGTLMHSSVPDEAWPRRPAFTDRVQLDFGGHAWTLAFVTLPEFESGSAAGLAIGSFVIFGILMSVALFWITRSLAHARARAEASERGRSRFFAAMSHELRTPINAIVGYNDLLLGDVFGPLPSQQRHGIERSQNAARHLVELVNDVLDLSKLEAGKLVVEPAPTSVPEMLDDLLSTIRPMAQERGCPLVLDTARCTRVITTDARRVRQILLNLLSNATKFGEGKPIVVRCTDTPDGVGIEVVDRGPGLAPEDLGRVFEEFVQLDSRVDGTGLGLTISRRLAALLGGRLDVDSELGRGSTFRLVLPAEHR